MKLHRDVRLGVETHTGRARSSNEDDFLVLEPADRAALDRFGRLLVIADGMGGVVGGAEASRTAVRALATAWLESQRNGDADPPPATHSGEATPQDRMRAAFARACQEVWDVSRANPRLRDMGTTLTAANLIGGLAVIGHVGDTRCYLLRNGTLRQLTEDHAVRGSDNHLSRCVGGGRPTELVDVVTVDLAPGDLLLLATDGLWNVVPADAIVRLLRTQEPAAAARALVREANERGGPDNSTALILRWLGGDPGEPIDVQLPAEEIKSPPGMPARVRSLRGPSWPWFALVASLVVAAAALARLVFGVDVVAHVRSWW